MNEKAREKGVRHVLRGSSKDDPRKTCLTPFSRELRLLALLAVICIGFGLANENFRDPREFLDRTRQWVEIGLIAVPMTFIIATAGIDLSVGSLLALSGVVVGLCFRDVGLPLPAAMLCGVLAGAAGGAVNGLAVSRLRVPPLVGTLATMAIFRGLAMGLSQSGPISDFPDWFTGLEGNSSLETDNYPPPYQTLLLVVVVGLGSLAMRRTCVGRWAIQTGENTKAARFSAIPVGWLLFSLYTVCGLVCGLAAVIYTARFATARPGAATGLELEVIACVVIGGSRITGGNGSVLGTFLGVLILGTLRFGLDMSGVGQDDQMLLVGFLVIGAAIGNEWLARRSSVVLSTTKHEQGEIP